jgi:methylmalonyl-CoA/ethylmalonyl-CoA epimerase
MPVRLNHVAVATTDFQSAVRFWHEVIGLPIVETTTEKDEAVQVSFLDTGNSLIEIVAPMSEESGVSKFLDKRGPGMHHLCLEVDDLDTTLNYLTTHGVELINETPRTKHGQIRYAFAHPKSTGGVLIEFYELPEEKQQ